MSDPQSNNPPASVFLSHGVSALAADDLWPSTMALKASLKPLGAGIESVVIVSAHWESDITMITADSSLPILDEGLATKMIGPIGPFKGSPPRAQALAKRLSDAGIGSQLVTGRGLDHGATIALRLLDPAPDVTVIQVSLSHRESAEFFVRLGAALAGPGSLLVGSGGAVHNLSTLTRFAPAATPPPTWAADFDAQVTTATESGDAPQQLASLMHSPGFSRAHPTNEHFVPLLVAAGAGATPSLLHHSWQWSTLSMRTYSFST